jgi:type II secretory pathway pseudopilin PulG
MSPSRETQRRDGFALIMVLVALAVMSLLLIALVGGGSRQERGAEGDASLAREKMLADTAAALVIGQIRQASTQPGEAWISQPGLLRTYAATSARTPSACYKLYSSPQMIDPSGSLSFLASDAPTDWNSSANQSVYTDLNAPVDSLSGDPVYPILDAHALDQVMVNGATVSRVPGVSSDAGHVVEMPVAWLYELQDGTLASPSAATTANPIAGRIAFWTDDETCKIDINTAGEASPWNSPHADSVDDVAWASTQPASNEFARYPGHPAGVSLSTIFGTNTTVGLLPDQLPTTFQPGCAYPEVSDACTIRISGLKLLTATSNGASGDFGFPAVATSRLLSDALTVAPADRAWGGFEGSRAAALDAMAGGTTPYAFAGTKAFAVPLKAGARDSKTGGPSLPSSWAQTLTVAALPGLTVQICDRSGATMQTFTVDLPSFSAQTPTVDGEADHDDGSTPATSHADWATNAAYHVFPSYYMCLKNRLLATQRSRPLMIQAGDMSVSVEAKTDLRLIASLASVPDTFFGASTTSTTVTGYGGTERHDLRFADGTSACWMTPQDVKLTGYAYGSTTPGGAPVTDWNSGATVNYTWLTSPACSAPTGTSSVTMKSVDGTVTGPAGDWDTGLGLEPDGALVNLPDAGTTLDPAVAYESLAGGQVGAATRRAPNALIPSPVVFGSLPAGINPANPASSQPWRTLLFCPYPSGDQAHPGLVMPPDYLLLDRFWMPTVEPYGISTCMETAGKINLNDQIAPFTYLHRSTALRALLHGVRIPAVSPAVATTYKIAAATPIPTIWNTIDEDATVQQIENRFATGDAYLTEGEICSVPLVPSNLRSNTLENYWTSRTGPGYLTGDNLRELPYAQLYSRLTTKSNSYTVHMRVQVLQKLNDHSNPAVWREGTDLILGDWRGSYEIERYLDPAATAPAAGQPLGPYKYRIVSARRFTP